MLDDLEQGPSLNLENYWAILCRRRWWFLVPLFIGWAVVWGISWFLPPLYRSETLILVEEQRVPEQYVVPNIGSDLQTRLQSMTQQILSRTRLLRIMESSRLYLGEQAHRSPEELVARMRKDIEIELVRGDRRGSELTAFKINFSAPDPHLAQQVTGQLASLFIEENLRERQAQSENTTSFLESQLEEARKKLETQENRLREFKNRYLGQLPEQVQTNVQILVGLQTRVEGMFAAVSQAEQQKLYLESLLAQYRSLQTAAQEGKNVGSSPRLPEVLEAELERLKARLADLSAQYTDLHPDVQRLKQQIAETQKLRQQIEADLARSRTEPKKNETSDSSAVASYADLGQMTPMMQVESQLKANQLEIENRKREIQELEARITQYQARLNSAPTREQQLAELTRDYEQSRNHYQSLLAKRMQSELATDLERRQQGEQFRILDPPILPRKPHWPDRRRFSLISIVAGVLLGLVSVVGLEMIDDRVYEETDLSAIVSAPVLAAVPPLLTSWEQRRQRWRRRLEWLGGGILLALVGAGNFVSFYWG